MAVFRELTGNINFIDVTSLPTTDIKDQVIYRLAKGNQYLFYTYNKTVSKWIQIDKSVLVVTTTAEMLNDTTKTYYLSQVDGVNQIGYYVVLNNTPTRLVTTTDIEDIKSTVNTASQNASSALDKATTAETNANTALSTANTANSTATNANSVATTANTTANTAKEKADNADTKADTAISTANEALNKANSIASVYRPQPSVETLADLPKPSAITAHSVYNIKTAFVTNADFIEGAGVPYPAGTNVAVVLDGYTYKYDPLAGFVDLSNYQEKLKSGVNIKTVNGQSILGSGDLQIQSGSDVIANPTLAGTEPKLTGLQVGETKYAVGEVIANPELAGTESKLNGIEVNGAKYSVGDIGEITIEQTQMLSETQIQLTEEQANILKAFSFVYVKIPFAGIEQFLTKYGQNDQYAVFVTQTQINVDSEAHYTQFVLDYTTNIVTQTEISSNAVIANAPNATEQLNTLRVGDKVYTILPTVTSADSGKFLTVNSSGQWVATTVPNAETTSF